jgi:hypothetical protein
MRSVAREATVMSANDPKRTLEKIVSVKGVIKAERQYSKLAALFG